MDYIGSIVGIINICSIVACWPVARQRPRDEQLYDTLSRDSILIENLEGRHGRRWENNINIEHVFR
jgi:hypothetical protein